MTDKLNAALVDAAMSGGPVTIALMRILIGAPDEERARAALVDTVAAQAAAGNLEGVARLRAVEALWRGLPDAWRVVRAMVDNIAHQPRRTNPEETPRYWAEAFDRLVESSPEASVALYSLGSPELLAAATHEIVARMEVWGLLDRNHDALDLGCGIGRFVGALAPLMRSVVGLDISARMIEAARLRCAYLQNVSLARSSGLDLGMLADGSIDLVLAADVFPYLVLAGGQTVRAHFMEIGRVLRPGGRILILNYSYGGDLDRDRRDIAENAGSLGLVVERNGTRDFHLWDAVAFQLRR
jgi:SAM-dependent methyltransferase